jgi:hypothetical protein
MGLPERWCLKISTNNIKELESWRIKQPNVSRSYACEVGSWLVSRWNDNTYLSYSYSKPGLYTEITIDEFRKYTTKKSIKERIKLLKI